MALPAGTWRPAYIGIGSNLGEPVRQVLAACDALDALPETRLIGRSSLYCSAAYGGVEQPDFVNLVAALLTRLSPQALLTRLQALEALAGRQRDGLRWGPRELDLDLLVYSGETAEEPGITLPHPGIAARTFVLLPLSELAPDLVIPGLGRVQSLPVDWHEPRIARMERICL
jgi:2-amino-4-hydroxy-6-hydroxymethyldihydropteridine diphosphokinase